MPAAASGAVSVTVTAPAAAQAPTTLAVCLTPDGQLTLELSGYRETVQLTISNTSG